MNSMHPGKVPVGRSTRPGAKKARTTAEVLSWRIGWTVAFALGLTFLGAYSQALIQVSDDWARYPQYSHGYLVPFFAIFLLWIRKPLWEQASWHPNIIGAPVLAAGLALWNYGILTFRDYYVNLSLIITLAGVVLFVGGRSIFRWAWPAIGFLIFMLPLPFRVEDAFSQQLRNVATQSTTYLLQTLGYPAVAEGNIILLDDIRLGVEAACSGIGMLMTFFALATAMAFLVDKPWQRVVLILSAVPIAVIVNVLRITATGIAHYEVGKELANLIMHDLAGWLMMPMALGLLGLTLWFLKHLFYDLGKPLPVLMKANTGKIS